MRLESFLSPDIRGGLARGFAVNPAGTRQLLDDIARRVVDGVNQTRGAAAALETADDLRKQIQQLELIHKKNRLENQVENQEKRKALKEHYAASRSVASPSDEHLPRDFHRLNAIEQAHVRLLLKSDPGSAGAVIRSLLPQGNGVRR
jgi:hypothetical protein